MVGVGMLCAVAAVVSPPVRHAGSRSLTLKTSTEALLLAFKTKPLLALLLLTLIYLTLVLLTLVLLTLLLLALILLASILLT